jgi:hypothetical protein
LIAGSILVSLNNKKLIFSTALSVLFSGQGEVLNFQVLPSAVTGLSRATYALAFAPLDNPSEALSTPFRQTFVAFDDETSQNAIAFHINLTPNNVMPPSSTTLGLSSYFPPNSLAYHASSFRVRLFLLLKKVVFHFTVYTVVLIVDTISFFVRE